MIYAPAPNWSELIDPAAGNALRDCSHGSYLGVVEDAGVSAFPLGVRTWQEREAFEDEEGLAEPPSTAFAYDPRRYEEQGTIGYGVCDLAAQRRYGVMLRTATNAALPGLLARSDVSVAIQGQGYGLPAGRCGPHSIRVVPLGDGRVLVFDPRRPMNEAGAPCPASTIIAWHAALPEGQIRWAAFGEFATPPFEPRTADVYTPIDNARVVDTRISSSRLPAGTVRYERLAGLAGVPATARALAVKVAVVAESPGWMSLRPVSGVPVEKSAIDYRAGVTDGYPILALDAGGGVYIFATSACHYVIDVLGYFE